MFAGLTPMRDSIFKSKHTDSSQNKQESPNSTKEVSIGELKKIATKEAKNVVKQD